MKAFLVISIFAFLNGAYAKDEVPTVKVPVEEGFKDMDMNEFKDIEQDPSHTNIVITCKLPDGRELSKGDKGFDKCVSRANGQKTKPLKPRRENVDGN